MAATATAAAEKEDVVVVMTELAEVELVVELVNVAEVVAEVAEAAAEMAAEAEAVAMAMSTRPTDEGRTDGCVAAGRAGDQSPVPPS